MAVADILSALLHGLLFVSLTRPWYVVVRILTEAVLTESTIGFVRVPACRRSSIQSGRAKRAVNNCEFLSFFGTFLPLFASQSKRGRNVHEKYLFHAFTSKCIKCCKKVFLRLFLCHHFFMI